MNMGDVVELRPYDGKAFKDGKEIASFQVKSDVLFDEVRAGGRIPLIIGRGLTAKAREALGLKPSTLVPPAPESLLTPRRVSAWHRRWSVALAVCPKVKACAPVPTASPR